jgi:hypothetical protein
MLERFLLDLLGDAARHYLSCYTGPDGELVFRDRLLGRDGVDDFYESFYQLPILYLLGGDADLLELSHRQWNAVTRQLSRLGMLEDEFERGFDWFHQGEAQLFFYNLCLADPENPVVVERARRFAALYASPNSPNYDREANIIRAPHSGSGGPRWGFFDDAIRFPWSEVVADDLAPYGLPFDDVEGIHSFDDLRDPAMALRMGEVMEHRLGRGDVAVNLASTALVANAYLLTGEESFREWIRTYLRGWRERAAANGGLLPDNVGPGGDVGELTGGRWYGGLYGWTWPHGLYSVGMAAAVAGTTAALLDGDGSALELTRAAVDAVLALGRHVSCREIDGTLTSLLERAIVPLGDEVLVVPYRRSDDGWFDFNPAPAFLMTAIWASSLDVRDERRLEHLRETEGTNWSTVVPFRGKEDNGHERPWLSFLAGLNPDYPEAALRAACEQVYERLEKIADDESDMTRDASGSWLDIHHWQTHNPLTVEALLQLTMGTPAPLYNGGLLHAPIRYFDVAARRPGLPASVAALVTGVSSASVSLELHNLSAGAPRELLVQAGSFAEHTFTSVRIDGSDDRVQMYAPHVAVLLPPSSSINLELAWERFSNTPTALPPRLRTADYSG